MGRKPLTTTREKRQAVALRLFFEQNQYILARDYAGNFNRGTDLYYKEIVPKLYFVFSNNHFSLTREFEQFQFNIVEAQSDRDFIFELLQKEPRIVVKRFSIEGSNSIYEQELAAALEQ